jgi:hypothetical protein
LTATLSRRPARAVRPARRGHPSRAASQLADAVLAWEGVTARRGEARLGREPLGRLPRHVRAGELERVVEMFRERYERAANAVDRRAGVRA